MLDGDLAAEYEQAEGAIREDRPDAAIDRMRGVLEKAPESARAFVLIAQANMKKGAAEAARAAIVEALRIAPEDVFAHAIHGHVLALLRRRDQAREEFERALSLNPGNWAANYWFAALLLVQGDLHEARRHAETARSIRPQSADGLALLGQCLARMGEEEAAEEALRKAVFLEPQGQRGLHGLGSFLLARGRPKEAYEPLREALRLRPESSAVRRDLLAALRPRHPVYGLLWGWSLGFSQLRRQVWVRVLLIAAVLLPLAPVAMALAGSDIALVVLLALLWIVDPLFTYFVRTGRVR